MRWIFFDCFNTLLDEEDGLGDESGMRPIAHLPAEVGLFANAAEFQRAYLDWRAAAWSRAGEWPEIPLAERLRMVLASGRARDCDIEGVVNDMVSRFRSTYPETLTPARGVVPMLEAWRRRARLAVVSNFFLPGLPEQLLEGFGLRGYFDFVMDSATLGFKKPDPRIYETALLRAGCRPGDAVFVGDNLENDVVAPMALGVRGVYLNRRSTAVPGGAEAIGGWDEFRPFAWPAGEESS